MVTPLLENRSSASAGGRRPLVIAHRGASGLAPENTLAAFRLAIALGADGVEMDVRLSADRRPVVIHDRRIDRTTDGKGLVAGLNSGELGGLDAARWFERQLSIRPRVRAMAERAAGVRAGSKPIFLAGAGLRRIYIELKGEPAGRRALIEAVVALVRDFRLERSVTLLSFDHEAVRLAKGLAPEVRTAATFALAGRALVTARAILRSAETVAADEVALHYGLATRRVIAALRDRGLGVSVWTANRPLTMRLLIARGVDAIMTNFPDRLIRAIEVPPRRRLGSPSRNGGAGRPGE